MMLRLRKLWKAICRWWRNEPLPAADPIFLKDARKVLKEYDESYSKRVGADVRPEYSSQAAEYVLQMGLKRAPTLESEVRMLAIVVERMLGHLEQLEQERAHNEAQ